MKKTLSICLLWLFMVSITTLVAQVQVDSSKFKPYWELNIDLLPIIKQNIVPIKSIGFRRPFKQHNNIVKAFRGRIGVDYFYDYYNAPKLSVLVRDYRYEIELNSYLSFGLDWQKNFQKWEYFYGIELINSFDFKRKVNFGFDFTPLDKDATKIDFTNEYFYKLRFAGIIGVRRKLSDRILLGIESSLQAGFNRRHVYGQSDIVINKNSTKSITGTGENYQGYMNLQPIYTLNLIYQLKKRIKNEKNNVFNNTY